MAVDLRQVMASFLTFSMFVMLGNMIKKDHIDPLLEPAYPESPNLPHKTLKVSGSGMFKSTENKDGLWKETDDIGPMKPCWKIEEKNQSSNGYIFFSLTHGPEYHASQVANAVAVARHLGAKLAIPDIRGTTSAPKRHMGEIYDVDWFIRSLSRIVRVDKNPPSELANSRLPTVRVPDRVSGDFISSKMEPIFRSKRSLKIVTHYNSSRGKTDNSQNAYECLAMFGTLKPHTELQQLLDSTVGTLRRLSQGSGGRFVAVDLREDALKSNLCREGVRKRCHDAREMGKFLKKIGVPTDASIYLTQTGWSSSLAGLRDEFPNTFTKDAIVPPDQKAKLMDSEYGKLVDFHMCREGDVFVPAFPSRFYSGVVGRRIGEGKTRVFVPASNASVGAAAEHVSPFIAKRTHFAYSCFC